MADPAKSYTRTFEDILAQEHLRIRPAADEEDGQRDFTGLAISGGGIRSASFATGVLQGLVAGDLLEKLDYLSTVSGGGYIGCSLSWYLTRGMPDPAGTGTVPAGTTAADFPYGSGYIGGSTGPRRPPLDYIRDHGRYLTPDTELTMTSAISVVVRSMFTALTAYLLLIWLVMVVLRWAHLFQDYAPVARLGPGAASSWLNVSMNPFWWSALALLILLAALSLLFSMRTAAPALYPEVQYDGLYRAQKIGGYGITAFCALMVLGSLPYFNDLIGSLWARATTAGLSTLLGTVLSAYEILKKDGSVRFGRVRLLVGAMLMIYGLLQAGYLLSASVHDWRTLLVLAGFTLAIGGMVNINHVGLHRMYRDRLMEAFMPDADTVREGYWKPAGDADKALLEEFCKGSAARPFHLINTNIVLIDSLRPKYRGRAGHSFVLSPLYCGGDATGWRLTEKYMKGGWSMLGSRGLTFATAMAISGAAANPNAGVAGRGITRNPLVSALMTLLNLRLGFWAVHPERESAGSFPPNFLSPGLCAGIFGRGLRESAADIELTDGGHFENLGLYELLRRRLSVIIASDAAADPDYRFGDLANAIERARVDFGVEIVFRKDYPLADIIPRPKRFRSDRRRIPWAIRPYAVADIYYNNGPGVPPDQGMLIYLKSTLIDGLSEDILGYYTANPVFPNQPTTDQFFDEAQFEAYRELGYQLTLKMVERIKTDNWL